jgi:hypothetical protein
MEEAIDEGSCRSYRSCRWRKMKEAWRKLLQQMHNEKKKMHQNTNNIAK